jgi:hypothetical protein
MSPFKALPVRFNFPKLLACMKAATLLIFLALFCSFAALFSAETVFGLHRNLANFSV